MPELNVALLKKTLETIELDQIHWDQNQWRASDDECGTTMCFAGWAALLAGGTWYLPQPVEGTDRRLNDLLIAEDGEGDLLIAYPTQVRCVSARDRAQRVLGLDEVEAGDLFSAEMGLEELEDYVDFLITKHEAQKEDA